MHHGVPGAGGPDVVARHVAHAWSRRGSRAQRRYQRGDQRDRRRGSERREPPPGGRAAKFRAADERPERLWPDRGGPRGQGIGETFLSPGHHDSSPSALPSAAMPRAAADLTVPALTPSVAAISASDSPAK